MTRWRIRETLPNVTGESAEGASDAGLSPSRDQPPDIGKFISSLFPQSDPPTPLTSRTEVDTDEALTSGANWRWFHGNAAFAEERVSNRQPGISLRHHAPVTLQRRVGEDRLSQFRPSTVPPLHVSRYDMRYPLHIRLQGATAIDPTHATLRRNRRSTGNLGPSMVPVSVQAISSISRTARASFSGQFPSLVPHQSAIREERSGRMQEPVVVPRNPFETLPGRSINQSHENCTPP